MSEVWNALLQPLLSRAGVSAEITDIEPLSGGVSSDIVRIGLSDGRNLCAKRALARLKVASVWEAPLERNHYEAEWLRLAARLVPGVAPQVLAEDRNAGIVVLEFLPATDYTLWKAELLAGRYDPELPARVATALGRIHAATWGDPAVAESFATDAMFDALRLDPYLRTLAARVPDLAEPILAVIAQTATSKLALVHGDVSPKNILISRHDGHPVLLDAECAWFGDPAFDAAFCMNHLLLKAVHVPAIREPLLHGARSFKEAWLAQLPSAAAGIEARLAALLPCLLLARVDGKSPVEYLDEAERERVRQIARPLIRNRPATVAEIVDAVAAGS